MSQIGWIWIVELACQKVLSTCQLIWIFKRERARDADLVLVMYIISQNATLC